MTQYILYIFGSIVVSVACGFIFIPMILDFCKEKNLYDIPNSRKVHRNAVPRLGGISFLPSMLIASLVMILALNDSREEAGQVTFSLWSLYFFVSLLMIYGVGIVDDLIGLGAKTKFVVQIVAASLLPLSGLYINNLYGLLGIYEIPYAIGAPLTVFVIVFINNAVNLIDGIDGLSASLSLIALAGFLICFMREGIWAYSILIGGLMGVLIPFLYFNLLGKAEDNRKIFMGDSGSLTLGFILGFLTVKYSMDYPVVLTVGSYNLLVAYTLLLVPMFDVVRVSLVRIMHRKPIFNADKNHIHHKLMRCGMNQHQALMAILVLALFFIGLNSVLVPLIPKTTLVVAIDIVVWMLFHALVNRTIVQRGGKVFLAPDSHE